VSDKQESGTRRRGLRRQPSPRRWGYPLSHGAQDMPIFSFCTPQAQASPSQIPIAASEGSGRVLGGVACPRARVHTYVIIVITYRHSPTRAGAIPDMLGIVVGKKWRIVRSLPQKRGIVGRASHCSSRSTSVRERSIPYGAPPPRPADACARPRAAPGIAFPGWATPAFVSLAISRVSALSMGTCLHFSCGHRYRV
jgi:hypothetical protein